jgi:hypothetical protein
MNRFTTLETIAIIEAPSIELSDGTGAFSTASVKLLRNRRFPVDYLGHAEEPLWLELSSASWSLGSEH